MAMMNIQVHLKQADDTTRGTITHENVVIHSDSIVGTSPEDKTALMHRMKEWMDENHPGWDTPFSPIAEQTAEPADPLADVVLPEPTELPPMPQSTIPVPPVTYPPIRMEHPEFRVPNSFA